MAKHSVSFELPKREMGKVDADFFIMKDGATLGKIRISKGGWITIPLIVRRQLKLVGPNLTK